MHEAGIADEDILALLARFGARPEMLTYRLAVILLDTWGKFVKDGRGY